MPSIFTTHQEPSYDGCSHAWPLRKPKSREVHPNNADSKAGDIYFHVTQENSPFHLTYWDNNISRKSMKQKTVDIVLSVLQSILIKFLKYGLEIQNLAHFS